MKQAMIFTRPRDTISFIVGLILFVWALIPLLNALGWIQFNLPGFLINLPTSVIVWFVAIGGLYVIIDGFVEPRGHAALHWGFILGGLILLIVGLIPILNQFGVIGFSLGPLNNLVVYRVIILIEGIMLMIGGVTEH